jgi:hypothetical protein
MLYSSYLPLGVPNGLVIHHASVAQIQNLANKFEFKSVNKKTEENEKELNKKKRGERNLPGQSLSSRPIRSPARHTETVGTRQAGPTREDIVFFLQSSEAARCRAHSARPRQDSSRRPRGPIKKLAAARNEP